MRAISLNAVAERIVIFPFLAFWRVRAARWKKVFAGQKMMRHNKGLCCIARVRGGGGGANFFFFAQALGSVPEKF